MCLGQVVLLLFTAFAVQQLVSSFLCIGVVFLMLAVPFGLVAECLEKPLLLLPFAALQTATFTISLALIAVPIARCWQ